ncbi:hypothetical protein ACSQ67_017798 [Phaseolus vulgaris]
MEFRIGASSPSTFSLKSSLLPPLKSVTTFTRDWKRRRSTCIQTFSVSYQNYVEFALDETRRHTHLTPSPLQEKFSFMNSKDGKGKLSMLSFEAAKIRLLRSLIIETETMQLAYPLCLSPQAYSSVCTKHMETNVFFVRENVVAQQNVDCSCQVVDVMTKVLSPPTRFMTLVKAQSCRLSCSPPLLNLHGSGVFDFAVFPEAEYDVPIFCANFFTSAKTNIVVLDLNPLHDVINQHEYKDKYFKSLIPLGLKYTQLFPWGGKLTSESIKFFSPIVIWTKFTSDPQKYDILYSAFRDYYKVWLEMICKSVKETDESQIVLNLEAQHRYLTWRVEKDPGQGVLKKLIGDTLAKDLLRSFLFNGVDELGSKTFYDYFPQYCTEEGTLHKKGNIVGKSFENRPWDVRGEFIGG